MPQGWIKLHRKILYKAFSSKPAYLALWIHILLMANRSGKEFIWNQRVIKLKEGQFITGRKTLSETTGIPETTIERILDFFEKEQQIGQQKTSKYRLITVLKWDTYQIRTTNGQQTDTNKNKENKEKYSETKVSGQLTGKNTDMGWKNKPSDTDDDLPVFDMDSREQVLSKEEQLSQEKKERTEKFRKAIDWLIEHQGRDKKRTPIPKQLKAIEKLYTMGVSASEAKQIIIECEGDPYWSNKQEKPDYWTVVGVIQKRG